VSRLGESADRLSATHVQCSLAVIGSVDAPRARPATMRPTRRARSRLGLESCRRPFWIGTAPGTKVASHAVA